MARARNIKPGFYKNEDLAECSVWARFIFPGLWMLADREGRLEDRPKRIKGELLPFDSQDVDPLLNELQATGFLVRYRNADGAFIQISKFSTHQNPHYSEKASVIKPPELPESKPHQQQEKPGTLPEDSRKTTLIKRGSQPPDSLIPDSLNPLPPNPDSRIPDSPNPLGGSANLTSPHGGLALQARSQSSHEGPGDSAQKAIWLRGLGVSITPQNPIFQKWEADGITRERYEQGVAICRERKPDGQIAARYLDAVLRDESNFQPKPAAGGKFDPVAYVMRTA